MTDSRCTRLCMKHSDTHQTVSLIVCLVSRCAKTDEMKVILHVLIGTDRFHLPSNEKKRICDDKVKSQRNQYGTWLTRLYLKPITCLDNL